MCRYIDVYLGFCGNYTLAARDKFIVVVLLFTFFFVLPDNLLPNNNFFVEQTVRDLSDWDEGWRIQKASVEELDIMYVCRPAFNFIYLIFKYSFWHNIALIFVLSWSQINYFCKNQVFCQFVPLQWFVCCKVAAQKYGKMFLSSMTVWNKSFNQEVESENKSSRHRARSADGHVSALWLTWEWQRKSVELANTKLQVI